SLRGFFQGDLDIEAKIRAALHVATSPVCAKDVVKAEEIPEYILESRKSAEAAAACRRAAHAGVTETILVRALIRFAQHAVGFGCLFELLFRFLIARILIWMIFNRK